jgi:hypothetical protein
MDEKLKNVIFGFHLANGLVRMDEKLKNEFWG